MDNPRFKELLRKGHGEAIKAKIEDKVTEALRKKQAAERKKSEADREKTRVQTDLDNARKRLGSLTRGKDKTDLAELEAANLDLELSRAKAAQRGADADLASLRSSRSKYPDDYDAKAKEAQDRLDSAMEKVDEYTKKVAKRDALKEERENLPEKIRTLEADLAKKTDDFEAADGEFNDADTQYTEALGERNQAESDFAASLEKLPGEALRQLLEEERALQSEAESKMLEEMETQTKDEEEQRLQRTIDQTYHKKRKPTWWNKSTVEDRKDKLSAHMRAITDPGSTGARGILGDMLRTDYQKQYLAEGLSAEEATAKAASATEAKLRDKEFVDRNVKLLQTKIIKGYVRNGGKITTQMYSFIQEQPGGEAVLEEALLGNDKVKEAEEKLKEANVLGPGGFKEFLKTKKGAASVGLVAILAGIGAGLITGPVGFGAASAAISGSATAYAKS